MSIHHERHAGLGTWRERFIAFLAPGLVLGVLAAPSARAQCEPVRLHHGDGVTGDRFGWSIATDDPWILVGAPGDDGDRGSLYFYERQGTEWILRDKRFATLGTAGDLFGQSCSVQGDTALVGAPYADTFDATPVPQAGAVYVFERHPDGWVEHMTLRASDPAPDQFLGFSCDLSGDIAVIGAPAGGAPTGVGAAYVFQREAGIWTETAKLTEFNADTNYGWSVAISDDYILVSAHHEDGEEEREGAVYVYVNGEAGWGHVQTLHPEDLMLDDAFGWSVAIAGDLALVGAPSAIGSLDGYGVVYAFERFTEGWTQTQRIIAPEGTLGIRFGSDCALQGDSALIGAQNSEDQGIILAGAVYRFARVGSAWTYTDRMGSMDPVLQGFFGNAVSLSDGGAAVGAFFERGGEQEGGSAYWFPPAVGGASSYCYTAPNSAGAGALISAGGTTSVTTNDLRLIVTAGVPSQAGLFYYGPEMISIPFGDGFRCVGNHPSGVFRLDPPQSMDFLGDATRALDLTQPPADSGAGAITVGSTWYFQFWYRDPWGPGGHGFNFSDGLAVTFCP